MGAIRKHCREDIVVSFLAMSCSSVYHLQIRVAVSPAKHCPLPQPMSVRLCWLGRGNAALPGEHASSCIDCLSTMHFLVVVFFFLPPTHPARFLGGRPLLCVLPPKMLVFAKVTTGLAGLVQARGETTFGSFASMEPHTQSTSQCSHTVFFLFSYHLSNAHCLLQNTQATTTNREPATNKSF